MAKQLTEQIINENLVHVTFGDKLVCKLVRDVDGFFYCKLDKPSDGLWGEWELRAIAAMLSGANHKLNEELNEYFYRSKPQLDEEIDKIKQP